MESDDRRSRNIKSYDKKSCKVSSCVSSTCTRHSVVYTEVTEQRFWHRPVQQEKRAGCSRQAARQQAP
eukprot:6199760-Pleurochrysis_carterae.AAC.2